jgi:hypothetical protein
MTSAVLLPRPRPQTISRVATTAPHRARRRAVKREAEEDWGKERRRVEAGGNEAKVLADYRVSRAGRF